MGIEKLVSRKRHLLTVFGLAVLGVSTPADALPVSVGLNLGKPLVFVDASADRRESLGATGSVGIDFLTYVPDYPFAVGVYYETFVFTDFGSLPINNTGMEVSYFPFGKPIRLEDSGSGVRSSVLDLSVYGSFGTGLSFFNIREAGGDGGAIFGASAFNVRLSGTVDYPIAETLVGGARVLYQTTFGGNYPDGEGSVSTGFTGWSLLGRIMLTLD